MLGARGWTVAALISVGAFWFVDLPETVRFKAAIVRSLPLSPQTMNSTIEALCKGAMPSTAGGCYAGFYSPEAEALAFCQGFESRLARNKDWQKLENGELHYRYSGPDPEVSHYLPSFFPSRCVFSGVEEGRFRVFSLNERQLFKLQ
jgi:hypothetical protein